MTEADWFQYPYWKAHLQFLGDRATPRKLRLLAAGFCRLAWDLFDHPDCREAVEVAERYADGDATVADLERCRQRCRVVAVGATDAYAREVDGDSGVNPLPHSLRGQAAWVAALVVGGQFSAEAVGGRVAEAWVQARSGDDGGLVPAATEARKRLAADHRTTQRWLVWDLFGNPYRPVTFAPGWRTDAAEGLARRMYDERDFAAMPALADALEAAGCGDAAVLKHCREGGVHARGCWVVDGVLGLA